MPKILQFEGTPAGGVELEGWALKLPFLTDSRGALVQLKGKQPSWHPMIHFVGYAGIARTALTAVSPPFSTTESVLVYAGCVVVALITGKLVKNSKSERFPRIASATLGTVAFAMAVIAAQISIHHPASRGGWSRAAFRFSAAGFMIMLNVAGEILTRWRSRQSRPGQPGSGQPGSGQSGPRQ